MTSPGGSSSLDARRRWRTQEMAGTCVEPEIPQGPTVSIESWYLSPSISDRKAQLLFHADITATHPERGCVRAVAPVNAPGAVGSLGRRGAGAGYSKGGTKNKDWRQQLRRHEADAARPTPRGRRREAQSTVATGPGCESGDKRIQFGKLTLSSHSHK